MIIIVAVLIYTVSLKLQLPPRIIIHNQCPNTKLVSPIYFGNGIVRSKLSDQQIDINTIMKMQFEISTTQDEFEGVLLYKLQGCSDSQHNMNTPTKGAKNEAKCVYMLVAWKMKDAKPFVRVVLAEHTKKIVWNEDKLKKLYEKNCSGLKKYDDSVSDTWIIDDHMILKTTFEVADLENNFELSVSISEEEKGDDAMRPLCIHPKR
jgi:hypothetical protein